MKKVKKINNNNNNNIENIEINEVVYPQIYEIKGCGSYIINDLYYYQGICNNRPYYTKLDNNASLWYFYTNLFPSSYWCGWYISKSVNTVSTNASEDYYSAYVHGQLPPSIGWVTRLPGISPTAGCGANPPPSFVGTPEPLLTSTLSSLQVSQNNLEKLIITGSGCSPIIPRQIIVTNAGNNSANGIYTFVGEISYRPYFRKIDGNECIWYFGTCPVNQATSGTISYNGWYISNDVATSSYSSAEDMYSTYSNDCIPQLSIHSLIDENYNKNIEYKEENNLVQSSYEYELFQKQSTELFKNEWNWIVRYPGLPPLSGCGKLPIPKVEYLLPLVKNNIKPLFVMLLRVSLPQGEIESIPISELDTILSVKLILEIKLKIPFYLITLKLRGISLSLLNHLEVNSISNDHNKIIETGITIGDIISVEILSSSLFPSDISIENNSFNNNLKNICIVGSGPVGLWIAIQLKILRPTWLITCFEKRMTYERSHALFIHQSAFDGMVGWIPGRPAAAELALLKDRWMPRTRTLTVESDLKVLAQNIGINIIYGKEVKTFEEVIQVNNNNNNENNNNNDIQNFDLIICCDGAKSSLRSQLISRNENNSHENYINKNNNKIESKIEIEIESDNIVPTELESNEFKAKKQLGSLLQVKFEAHGEVNSSKGQLALFLQNLPATNEFFNILPGNFDPIKCTTPMTIFALLNSDVQYTILHSKKMNENNLKSESTSKFNDNSNNNNNNNNNTTNSFDSSKTRSTDSSIDEIHNDLQAVLVDLCPGGIIEESMKISILPVAYSISKIVTGKIHNIPVFLAGDSAMGLPLEKGLNFGWKIASRLSHYLGNCDDIQSIQLAYQHYFNYESSNAIELVEKQYKSYVKTIQSASLLRYIVHSVTFLHRKKSTDQSDEGNNEGNDDNENNTNY